MRYSLYKKGFTLVELLVVIAITGILSTIIVNSLQSARGKARDSKRIEDLRALRSAFETYFNFNTNTVNWANGNAATSSLIAAGLLPIIPSDPQTPNRGYFFCASGSAYLVGALLENSGTKPIGAANNTLTNTGGKCIRANPSAVIPANCRGSNQLCVTNVRVGSVAAF